VREGLSNAVRHSQARLISIELAPSETGSVLVISDDGVGFDPTERVSGGHHGLANMRARAAAIGGSLEIRSAPGAGTNVVVNLPRRVAKLEDQETER
jgi:signal transduction histidine kinase